ncbi:MAG: hypothetical protein U5L11_17205 [Arhodomonas sp.]|nr:hypothetical protein [Arhodomonas sp.]
MRFKSTLLALGATALLAMAGNVHSEETDITVRVISKDAKFIGSSMGGVRVMLRDARSGELLREGVTSGGTGDTGKIMHEDGGRRASMADPSAAAFKTSLDLDRPRLIRGGSLWPARATPGCPQRERHAVGRTRQGPVRW